MTRTKARRGCRHTTANWSRWEDGAWVLVGHLSGLPPDSGRFFKDRLVCDCGEWLSLGPANDGGEHAERVAVEKRAAEIAMANGPFNLLDSNHAENIGWEKHYDEGQWPAWGWMPPTSSGQWAGYLSRTIWTHKDESPRLASASPRPSA